MQSLAAKLWVFCRTRSVSTTLASHFFCTSLRGHLSQEIGDRHPHSDHSIHQAANRRNWRIADGRKEGRHQDTARKKGHFPVSITLDGHKVDLIEERTLADRILSQRFCDAWKLGAEMLVPCATGTVCGTLISFTPLARHGFYL